MKFANNSTCKQLQAFYTFKACKAAFSARKSTVALLKCYFFILQTARVQEQEERKLWGNRQKAVHTYGADNDEDDDVDSDDGHEVGVSQPQEAGISQPHQTDGSVNDGTVDIILNLGSKKTCRCGASTHQRTSSKKCPFNKKNLPDVDVSDQS